MDDNFKIEFRIKVLLSTYEALIGRVSRDVRLISIDWSDCHFWIRVIFDREINDDDIDEFKAVSTEVAADFPSMTSFREKVVFSNKIFGDIDSFGELVFLRKGELDYSFDCVS